MCFSAYRFRQCHHRTVLFSPHSSAAAGARGLPIIPPFLLELNESTDRPGIHSAPWARQAPADNPRAVCLISYSVYSVLESSSLPSRFSLTTGRTGLPEDVVGLPGRSAQRSCCVGTISLRAMLRTPSSHTGSMSALIVLKISLSVGVISSFAITCAVPSTPLISGRSNL